jgi:hypothetical protein
MKNAFKFLSLGVLMMAFYAVSATSIFAQGTLEECNAIYERFKKERTGAGIPEWTAAIASGKEYLQKCSTLDPPQEEVKTYVTNQIPKLETKIAEKRVGDMEARFNAGLKANNTDEIIASAKDLISLNRPYNLDLILSIAAAGFDRAASNPPVDKYNQDAITYAKMALQQMEAGKTSGNADKYGFFIEYKTQAKECTDGKLNATGWMNYIIGYITYARMNQKKEALPYLYKSTQTGCFTKTLMSEPYRLIGAWYLDETIKLNNEYAAKTKANGDKENDETLAMLAMIKGYAERALDAYARAYKVAQALPGTTPTYKENLLKRIKEMADVRYGDATKADSYIAEVSNKPFVDPTTPVTPVVEAAPATGTPTTSSSLTNSSGDTSAAAVAPTRTASTSNAGTATPSSTAPKTPTTTPAKKPAAKKPAPKKKGTR